MESRLCIFLQKTNILRTYKNRSENIFHLLAGKCMKQELWRGTTMLNVWLHANRTSKIQLWNSLFMTAYGTAIANLWCLIRNEDCGLHILSILDTHKSSPSTHTRYTGRPSCTVYSLNMLLCKCDSLQTRWYLTYQILSNVINDITGFCGFCGFCVCWASRPRPNCRAARRSSAAPRPAVRPTFPGLNFLPQSPWQSWYKIDTQDRHD